LIYKEQSHHGRAAAVTSDEISSLVFWREWFAGEATAGRDALLLRDVIKSAVERLNDMSTTPALDSLRKQFIDSRERELASSRHLSALKNRLKRFNSYFDRDGPAGAVTTEDVQRAMASMREGGFSPQSVKGVREAAHGVFSWAMILKRKMETSPYLHK
jgi:hypothetical protein